MKTPFNNDDRYVGRDYGTFEYPKESGQWYQGKHEPIITKELFDKAQEQGEDFENAIRLPLTAILVSPRTVMLWGDAGVAGPGKAAAAVRPLDDFELATRLSYFLWSSLPDRELFQAAEKGRLRDPQVIEEWAEQFHKYSKQFLPVYHQAFAFYQNPFALQNGDLFFLKLHDHSQVQLFLLQGFFSHKFLSAFLLEVPSSILHAFQKSILLLPGWRGHAADRRGHSYPPQMKGKDHLMPNQQGV